MFQQQPAQRIVTFQPAKLEHRQQSSDTRGDRRAKIPQNNFFILRTDSFTPAGSG